MTGYEPTPELIEAAAIADWECEGDSWAAATEADKNDYRRAAAAVLAVVVPLIREQIAAEDGRFDFRAHLTRQREWSERTFGPGERTEGVIAHIRKELVEVEAEPNDPSEWIDVVILALDGAWRHGSSPDEIIGALVGKQERNEQREWPDWRTAGPGPIEHVRRPAAARVARGED